MSLLCGCKELLLFSDLENMEKDLSQSITRSEFVPHIASLNRKHEKEIRNMKIEKEKDEKSQLDVCEKHLVAAKESKQQFLEEKNKLTGRIKHLTSKYQRLENVQIILQSDWNHLRL